MEWISVDDELPEEREKVLIIKDNGRWGKGYWRHSQYNKSGHLFVLNGTLENSITHWARITEPK